MTDNTCPECGGTNTYWHEDHPDTGMDEMSLVCRDCKVWVSTIPWRGRLREWLNIKWNRIWGRVVVQRIFRLARWSAKQTFGYCTWCGRQPGFDSSVSRKGLRCRDCEKY